MWLKLLSLSSGGCDYTKALEFVKEEFHKLNQKPQTKQVPLCLPCLPELLAAVDLPLCI